MGGISSTFKSNDKGIKWKSKSSIPDPDTTNNIASKNIAPGKREYLIEFCKN